MEGGARGRRDSSAIVMALVVFMCGLVVTACGGDASVNVSSIGGGSSGPEYIIGNDTPGGSLGFPADSLTGHAFTVPNDTNVLRFGIISFGGGVNVKFGLYTDTGAQPNSLVVSSAAVGLTNGSEEFGVTSTPIPAGTYWIMFVMDGATSIGDTGGSFPREAVAHTFGLALPGVLTTSPALARDLNLWMVVQDD